MAIKLGDKIRQRRKELGLTLDKLVEKSGVSKSYLWELENSKEQLRPSADKLTDIAKALDVTLEFLIDKTGQTSKTDAVDAAFFREYQGMDKDVKEKIRDMVKLWSDKK